MQTHADHRTRTLWLSGILHAFTHMYHVALLPLYLMIQKDLKLQSVSQATLFVTVMMVSYYVPSYFMGILADRMSRKLLLAIGLALNGLGFAGLALAPNYSLALLCVALAGFGGSFYHPAATAMVARLYPANTGKALGLVAIGASVGFFIAPIYTGWRASSLEATAGAAAWRQPVLELGVLGIIMSGIFYWFAQEEPTGLTTFLRRPAQTEKMFPTQALFLFFVAASFCFAMRDFAGAAMGSLGSLFLQTAHHYDTKQTGVMLSAIFVASAVSNPVIGKLSDYGRMRWACIVLVIAAAIIAIFPHVPISWCMGTFFVYGFFFLANYPIVEAAVMESVHDAVRGRVFGFFITVGGLLGNLAHWAMGEWVKHLGTSATEPTSYYTIYGGLALLVILSLAGLPCLHAIRRREFDPAGHEINPAATAQTTTST